MDKSDVALLLSAVSAVTAVGSLIYARRIALNDSARMKRKQLVFETSSTPCKEYPDWHSVTVIIRNFEPVSATVLRVKSKRHGAWWSARARLLSNDYRYEMTESGPNPWSAQVERLPDHLAKHDLEMNRWVPETGVDNGVVSVSFFATKKVISSDLLLYWEWNDGTSP